MGTNLVEPFCYCLFSACSVVNVECCALYPCYEGVYGMFVPLFMSLLGFGMETMLAKVHMCGIMLLLEQF